MWTPSTRQNMLVLERLPYTKYILYEWVNIFAYTHLGGACLRQIDRVSQPFDGLCYGLCLHLIQSTAQVLHRLHHPVHCLILRTLSTERQQMSTSCVLWMHHSSHAHTSMVWKWYTSGCLLLFSSSQHSNTLFNSRTTHREAPERTTHQTESYLNSINYCAWYVTVVVQSNKSWSISGGL